MKKKVLIVDDELDIDLLFKTVLEEKGFKVDWYDDPEFALKNFKPNFYHLLIVDIKMAKMNGFELYRELNKIDNRIKVCFLTALSELQEYDKFKEEVFPKEGKRCFIQKAIQTEEMLERVKSMISST